MIKRHEQPLVLPRLEGTLRGGEIQPAAGLWSFQKPHTRIASAKSAVDLTLKLVHRLNGIPPRRPEERCQSSRRLRRRAFHRKGKRGIGILGRLRFADINVGQIGRPAAVTVRRAWNLFIQHAKL